MFYFEMSVTVASGLDTPQLICIYLVCMYVDFDDSILNFNIPLEHHHPFSRNMKTRRHNSHLAKTLAMDPTLLIFAVEVQVFTVSQIPLQFHCIFYRQTMQILNVKTAKKYLQWVVCKKCSETAVGFVQQ